MINGRRCADLLTQVRSRRPLVHHITNCVTINDCANITLCAGGAPVMADAHEEVVEMTGSAHALVLNIGTLSSAQVESMVCAGTRANELGIPVILDPVGAGATRMRTQSALRLLRDLEIAVLKGNAGEIGVISGSGGTVRGVDSAGLKGDPVRIVKDCAEITGAVVVMTGAVDIIADDHRVFLTSNGTPMMGQLSGTGCMASSLIGTFAAVAGNNMAASVAALTAFGRAGELASLDADGPYSFRTRLFDRLFSLSPEDLAVHARIGVPDGL